MGKIVAIGGGDIRKNTTLAIDKEIVRLSGKRHPRFLFLPTASSDSKSYWDFVNTYFTKLGYKTDVLFLVTGRPTQYEIKRKISSANIIYVGGGNTLKMMNIWRRQRVDTMLRAAFKRGAVLSGLSAGSICWFDAGHSDSMSYYSPKKWDYIRVTGLGLIKGIHCPHFESATRRRKRKGAFIEMMKRVREIGIAIEGKCAMEFVNNRYRIIQAAKGAGAYTLFSKNGGVKVRRIPQTKQFRPLSELYAGK